MDVTVTNAYGHQTVPQLYDHNNRPIESGRQMPIAPILTEASLIYGGYSTYFHGVHDEAMRNSRENALAMSRDEHLQRCLWERIRKVTALKFHLEIDDEDDPWQVAVRDGLTQSLNAAHRLRRYFRNHMMALWSGRAGNQARWEWMPCKVDTPRGTEEHRVLRLADHLPVNGDKIGYTLNLTPYVQIYGATSEGDLPGADFSYTTESRALLLTGTYRERLLLHNFNVIDADFWEPEKAGAVGGIGVRSYLYWSWWNRMEYLTAVLRSLDRFGLGFIVIEYPMANNQARQHALEAAKNLSVNRSCMVIPVGQGQTPGGAVKVIETPVSGAQVMLQLQQAAEEREERFIVGQTGSSRSATSGLGTHDPIMMQETAFALMEEDAQDLQETATGSEKEPGLLYVIQKHSYPWSIGAFPPPRLVFDCRPPDVEKKLGAVTMGWNLGVDYDKDEVRALTGMAKPGPGDDVLSNPALEQQKQQLAMAAQQGQVGPDGQPVSPTGQEGVPGAEGQLPEHGQEQPEEGDSEFAKLLES